MIDKDEIVLDYQARLGTPMDAINYALSLREHDPAAAIEFLNDWAHGDLNGWPGFKAAGAKPDRVPRALFLMGFGCLAVMAVLMMLADARAGAVFSLFLVLPASLLLQAANVKAPGI